MLHTSKFKNNFLSIEKLEKKTIKLYVDFNSSDLVCVNKS